MRTRTPKDSTTGGSTANASPAAGGLAGAVIVAFVGLSLTAAATIVPTALRQRAASTHARTQAASLANRVALDISAHGTALRSLAPAVEGKGAFPDPASSPLDGKTVDATSFLTEVIYVTAVGDAGLGAAYRSTIGADGMLTADGFSLDTAALARLNESLAQAADGLVRINTGGLAPTVFGAINTGGTDTSAASDVAMIVEPAGTGGWLLSPIEPGDLAASIDRVPQREALDISVHLGASKAAPVAASKPASVQRRDEDIRWAIETAPGPRSPVTVALGHDKYFATTAALNPLAAAVGGTLLTAMLSGWLAARSIRRRRRSLEAQLAEARYQARTDPLTGLGNRLACTEQLDEFLSTSDGTAVLLCDLDRFKIINDARGHDVGDDVLREVAQRLRTAAATQEATAVRLGGDEFALVMPTSDPGAALDLAEAVIAAIRRPVPVGSDLAVLGVSVGMVIAERGAHRADVLRDADVAMYAAKRGGGNRVAVAGDELRRAGAEQFELENAIRAALGTGQFRAWFQPIVGTDRRVRALEALVRWEHPERGILNPGYFLPAAKNAGLLAEISTVVLAQSCTLVARWNELRRRDGLEPLVVHVNCVEEQLTESGFTDVVMAHVQMSGIDPRCLILEISEETAFDRLPATLPTIELLRAQNICFSLDDFGFGNSSLTMVRRLGGVSEIKLDKSIVDGLTGDGATTSEADAAVIRAIAEFAATQGITLVAEGIEEEAQFRRLLAFGVELFQGYLFAKPQPPAVLDGLIAGAASIPTRTSEPALV